LADARIGNEELALRMVKNNVFLLEKRSSDSKFVGKIVVNNHMNTIV
jgi:hypothetical protein